MITAPRGKSTTEEDIPPQHNDLQPPSDPTSLADRTGPPERITVTLIPRAGEDLQRLQDQTNLSKTDIVNRAIALYQFIEAQRSAGRDVLIRDKNTGETQVILLI
jgi:hypothetical protein